VQPTLRAARFDDRRFTGEGVSVDDALALVPELLEFTARPRRNADVEQWLAERFGEPKPRVWWALRQTGPFVHAPSGGPWSFGPRPAFVAALQPHPPGDALGSVRHLVRRYLEGYGPATMQDIAQFTTIYRAPIKEALESLSDELVRHEGPDGAMFWDVAGGELPGDDTPSPPRLMAMWDSTLLAYVDRSRIIPTGYRPLVMRSNGDTLATLLVDGYVAGVWRPADGGIEVTAFRDLPDDAWQGIALEAQALTAFLAHRDLNVYSRYSRWWKTLPRAEVRTF
jgi:hypothetical protein